MGERLISIRCYSNRLVISVGNWREKINDWIKIIRNKRSLRKY